MAKRGDKTHLSAVASVKRKWGNDARYLLGDQIYEALVAREILIGCCAQDEQVSGEAIVKVMNGARDAQIDEMM